MAPAIPLAAFDESRLAVLMTDVNGAVCACNRAAAAVLSADPSTAIGRPCWEIARFRTPAGRRFCSSDCPVQRAARAKRPERVRTVLVRTDGTPAVRLDLLTFVLPNGNPRRVAALHVLLPIDATDLAGHALWRGDDTDLATLDDRLTNREGQILRLLAVGLGTGAIAERLMISRTTVRNHVQNILRKLNVHRRIEAVATLLGMQRQDRPSTPGRPVAKRPRGEGLPLSRQRRK